MNAFPVDMMMPPSRAARGHAEGLSEFSKARHELTAHIVQAVTSAPVEKLEETLDLLLEDALYQSRRDEIKNRMPWELMHSVLDSQQQDHFVAPHVPTVVVERVATAIRLEEKLFRAVARHVVSREPATGRIPIGPQPKVEHHPVQDFDADMPLVFQRAMLNHRLGEICGIALMSEQIVSSTLADALVDRWLEGLWGFIGLLDGASVLDGNRLNMPARYRVDVQKTVDEHNEANAGFVYALGQVEKSGEGYPQVYFGADAEDEDLGKPR